MDKTNIYYITSPFRHEIREIEDTRYACVTHALGKLWQDGCMTFSPITHTYFMRSHGYLNDISYATHLDFNKKVLRQCEELYVLTLPEWEESKGVAIEIAYAAEKSIAISHVDPKDLVPGYVLNKLNFLYEKNKAHKRGHN